MSQPDAFAIKTAADQARDKGRPDEALRLYDQAIALRPQFAAAYYEKGDVLSRKGQFIEAANCFMVAWVHGQFRKEPGLMCGRALLAAHFSLEACLVFERIRREDFDTVSTLYYADALRREFRIRDALTLLPWIGEQPDNPVWRRIYGDCYLEMKDLEKAQAILELGINDDDGGYIIDKLIALYYTQKRYEDLRGILNLGAQRLKANAYYLAQLTVLDIIEGKVPSVPVEQVKERQALVDSALYMQPYMSRLLAITGTTYQTFDAVAGEVPAQGLILEFGVRNGHSINYLGEIFPDRRIYGFDSFEGLPEAWNDEGAGSYSAGGRLPKVPSNVEFVVGWFNATLPGFKQAHPEPIAFMNVDCDLYSATKAIFDELDAQIVPGTVIVFDEYLVNDSWRQDEFKAFQEWVSANTVEYRYLTVSFYSKQAAVKILARKGSDHV